MNRNVGIGVLAGAFVLAMMPALRLSAGPRPDQDHGGDRVRDRHVLLISIDGMHALDYANCVSAGTCPHLAELGETGVTYTRTTTARPSDSFPGLMALVTGGTPKTVGAFYDVAYDRVLARTDDRHRQRPARHRPRGLHGRPRGGISNRIRGRGRTQPAQREWRRPLRHV